MTELEKLDRDLTTMLESISQSWLEIARGVKTRSENIPHIRKCIELGQELQNRIDELKGNL